ncbi:hypothetical protein [Pedobacter sp. SYSU D00535]|uniref:hypothetical protein n=1 Tax=Pedobacter sp. SYSU D00535 TaxID=2810308 RepID=UPI001A977CFD|nr:hypothetical protein [Pedobacter sp. SYSU D00535]
MKKTPILYVLFAAFLVLGAFVYFVSQFTSVYPPIRKFEYSKNVTDFHNDLRTLISTRPNISFQLTDTTGTEENGYVYYYNIKVIDSKKSNEFNVAFKTEENWKGDRKNTICLVGAYDRIHKVGGYSKESKGIDRLAKAFEQDVYEELKNTSP